MQPHQVTCQEWNDGLFYQRSLTDKEKDRLVDIEQVPPTTPDTDCTVFQANLDGQQVFAVVQKGDEPLDFECQKELRWAKVIPTGRRKLTDQEHRGYVEKALLLGKEIPAYVLAGYPELTSMQGAG